jgi:hypothetical protein
MKIVKGFFLLSLLISMAIVGFLNAKHKKEIDKVMEDQVGETQKNSEVNTSRAVENKVIQDLQQAQEVRDQSLEE